MGRGIGRLCPHPLIEHPARLDPPSEKRRTPLKEPSFNVPTLRCSAGRNCGRPPHRRDLSDNPCKNQGRLSRRRPVFARIRPGAPRARKFAQFTLPDLLEARYNQTARVLGTIAILFAYVGITSYQFKGGGNV